MSKPVYIVQHNHFDPIWHRCWDRTFDYRGNRYRSYADVEERVIDICLKSAKRGATFSEGHAVVFRLLQTSPRDDALAVPLVVPVTKAHGGLAPLSYRALPGAPKKGARGVTPCAPLCGFTSV